MLVSTYRVALFNRLVGYGSLGRCWTTAQIRISGGNLTGYLVFYDPEKTEQVPASRFANDPGGGMTIFIPKDQYFQHVDLLRNEHPLYLIENANYWTRGSLRTGTEDVGEGE